MAVDKSANSIKKVSQKVTLPDGLEYTVRYTMTSMIEIEDAYGSIDELFTALREKKSMRAMMHLIYAGLVTDQPDLTPRQLSDMLDVTDVESLASQLTKVLTESLPQGEKDSEEKSPTELKK